MRMCLIAVFFALTACGIDGDPQPVQDTKPKTGITVSGDARIGVTGTL